MEADLASKVVTLVQNGPKDILTDIEYAAEYLLNLSTKALEEHLIPSSQEERIRYLQSTLRRLTSEERDNIRFLKGA